MKYQGTAITEPPTLTGRGGQAWRVRMAPPGERERPDLDGTLDVFIVRVPGAHLLWDHWMVSMIHLRPITGVKPATVTQPGATHELMVVALNPEEPLPALDSGPEWRVRYLTPIDVIEQFTAADDATALQIFELAIRAMVDGVASPDQDYRSWWHRAIQETAAHFAAGTHEVRRQ